MSDTPAPPAPDLAEVAPPQTEPEPEPELVLDDLIVEDVSIDGMCGVY
jgi:mycofactocin precursor